MLAKFAFLTSLSLFLFGTQPSLEAQPYYSKKIIIPPINTDDSADDLKMEIKKSFGARIRRIAADKAVTSGADWGTIFKFIEVVGPKIWKIVEDNKPVVSRTLSRVSILPKGFTSATELHSWKGPSAQTYEIVFRNGLGQQVVALEYTVLFSYGGRLEDKGAYLANVTIDPGLIAVSWGYKFNLNAEIQDIVNTGTKENPVMGLYVNLNYTINTVLKHVERRNTFFLAADTGLVTFVNQPKSEQPKPVK